MSVTTGATHLHTEMNNGPNKSKNFSNQTYNRIHLWSSVSASSKRSYVDQSMANMQHLAELPGPEDGVCTAKQFFIVPYFVKYMLTGFQADQRHCSQSRLLSNVQMCTGVCFSVTWLLKPSSYQTELSCCNCDCMYSFSLAGFCFMRLSVSLMLTSTEWTNGSLEVWLVAKRFAQKVVQIPGQPGKM